MLADVISSMTEEEISADMKLEIVIRVRGRMLASIDLTPEMELFDVGVFPDFAGPEPPRLNLSDLKEEDE
jgi:hypothetical protein